MAKEEPFKVCTDCRHVWSDREEFLSDPSVRLEGYQVNFEDLEAGIFLFTHNVDNCGSTIAIAAGCFTDMHDGPVFEENHRGGPECDGSCLHHGVIDSCKVKCECAYVRDVLQRVRDWGKRSA